MTTAAAGTVARRRRLPWLLLALSLVLNLCFIGGALWSRLHKPAWRVTPAERLERMPAELHLDAAHRETFRHYFRNMSARLKLMREEVQPLVAEAWAEIAKPQPDEAKIARLFDQAAEARSRYQRELTSQTLAFLATLTPDQRTTFVQLARRRPGSWAKPGEHRIPPPSAAASR